MIDIKLIRQDPERYTLAARNKRMTCDIDGICALDDQRKAAQHELDQLKHAQNETGGQRGRPDADQPDLDRHLQQ